MLYLLNLLELNLNGLNNVTAPVEIVDKHSQDTFQVINEDCFVIAFRHLDDLGVVLTQRRIQLAEMHF